MSLLVDESWHFFVITTHTTSHSSLTPRRRVIRQKQRTPPVLTSGRHHNNINFNKTKRATALRSGSVKATLKTKIYYILHGNHRSLSHSSPETLLYVRSVELVCPHLQAEGRRITRKRKEESNSSSTPCVEATMPNLFFFRYLCVYTDLQNILQWLKISYVFSLQERA